MIVEEEVIQEANPRADNDLAWKGVLKALLKDFIQFFWYEAYLDIDWEKPYILLEQELLAIVNPNDNGKRSIDKLFLVHLKNGREQLILLHIEVQHSKDDDFSERMFVYFYRAYEEHKKDIATLAILADKNAQWRPDKFQRKIWGTEITRTYKVVKLIDYKSRKAELMFSKNPFATVILLQLEALETKPHQRKRLLSKLEFFRNLLKHGWDKDKIVDLYRFLDLILTLNHKNELEYIKRAKEIDREFNMNLTLTAERHGFREGEASILIDQLKAKFNEVPEIVVTKINSADAITLKRWGINFVFANTIDEVFKQ